MLRSPSYFFRFRIHYALVIVCYGVIRYCSPCLIVALRMSKANEYLPEFTEGEVVPVSDAKLADGQTSPPDYLTESELIELMVSCSSEQLISYC